MADAAEQKHGAYLLDLGGETVRVPAERVDSFLRIGYQPATPKQVDDLKTQEKFGTPGQIAITAAEQAGSALTFGLSTYAERKLGVPAENIAGREHTNPTTSMLSTGVGIAAPFLLTGGAAGAAEGGLGAVRAGAEFTAPSLIAKAGRAVTAGVEGALPEASGLAGRVLGKAAAVGAGSAVEGAFYGTGQVVHEAALGDPNLTAQSALAHIGLSAALGGGLGALGGAAEVAIPEAIKGARDAIGNVLNKARGGFEEAYPAIAQKMTGIDAETVSELLAKRQEIFANPEARNKLAGDLGDSLNKQYSAVEGALKMANREIRPVETETLSATADRAAVKEEYLRLQDRIQAVTADMRAEPELYPAMYPKKLEQIRASLWRDYAKDIEPAEAFAKLNETKQLLDPMARFGRDVPPEHADAIAAVKALRGDIKKSLESDTIWGEAGSRQAAFNDAQNEYLSAKKEFEKRFMQKSFSRTGAVQYKLNPVKVNTWFNQAADPRGAISAQALDGYTNSAKHLLDEIEKSNATAPTASFDREALTSVVNKTGDLTAETRRRAALGELMTPQPVSHLIGSIPGVGAVMGAIGTVKNVPKTVALLAKLERATASMSAKIDAAAGVLVRGSERAASVGRGEAMAGIARSFGHDLEDGQAAYTKRVAEVNRLANNPANAEEALTKMTDGMHEHAPQTAQAAQVAAARAVSFLSSKAPRPPQAGPLAPKWEPSQADMSKFNRYYEAVHKPDSILKQAAAGTLTPEGIEAVKTVYPDLFAKMQTQLLDRVAKQKGPVPYQSRLMLSMLLGQDMDGTMSPAAILANQKSLTGPSAKNPENQVAAGPIRPTAKGLGHLSLSNRLLTPAQAALTRGFR